MSRNESNTTTEKKAPTTSAKWWFDQYNETSCVVRKDYCLSQIKAFCAKHPESPNAAHNFKVAAKLQAKLAPDVVAALEADPKVIETIREGKGGAALRAANAEIAALRARNAELEAAAAAKAKAKAPKAKATAPAADDDTIG